MKKTTRAHLLTVLSFKNSHDSELLQHRSTRVGCKRHQSCLRAPEIKGVQENQAYLLGESASVVDKGREHCNYFKFLKLTVL